MNRNNQKIKKNFICIIPARSKSKGIKNKNIRIVGGKPLIYWTIKEALKCKYFSKVIVSTDSLRIKRISEKYGAECPFLRPKKLSGDRTSSVEVIQHMLNQLDKKNKKNSNDQIVLLQPTSPLRKLHDIKKSIKVFNLKKNKASSLISVTEVEDNHPARMYYMKNKYLVKNKLSEKNSGTPRQSLKKMFLRNGAIYILKRKNLDKDFIGKKPIGFVMPKNRSINIDDEFDLEIANSMITNK